MVKSVAASPELTGLHKDGSQAKLKKTCAEFESIFITWMMTPFWEMAMKARSLNPCLMKTLHRKFQEVGAWDWEVCFLKV